MVCPFFSFQILHMSTSHVWIQMSNVEIIFPNEFQKFPLLVLAFTNESWEENSSDNYQVSQNLRKLVQRKFPSEGNFSKKIDYFSKPCYQILVFDKQQVKWLQTRKIKSQEKI